MTKIQLPTAARRTITFVLSRLPFLLFLTLIVAPPTFCATIKINQGALLLTSHVLAGRSQAEIEMAKTHFEQALTYSPRDWRAYAGLGFLASAQEDNQEAVPHWRRAVELSPQPLLFYWLGKALEAEGEHLEALEAWRKAQAEVKFTTEGDEARRASQLQTARQRYELALQVNSEWEAAKQGLAQVLRQQIRRLKDRGEDEQAIALLKEVILLSPSADDFVLLGDYERQAEAFSQARLWYLQGQERYPQAPAPVHRLGLMALSEGKLEQAEYEARRAISLDEDYSAAYSLLGNSLRKQKRFQEAEEVFLEGMARQPKSSWLHVSLGDLYHEQGRINEAKAAYQRALELSPDAEYIRQRIERLNTDPP